MKKYRYISSGCVKPSDEICKFRLIGAPNIGTFDSVIRICVDDIKLDKYSCDCYSTTDDTRSLEEIGYDILVRINWKLVERNDLKPLNEEEKIDDFNKMLKLGYSTGMRLYKGRTQYSYLDKDESYKHYSEIARLGYEKFKKELAECGGDYEEYNRRICEKIENGEDDMGKPMIVVD